MSRAASLPGAELFLRNQIVFEQATCPGQLRCRGQNFFSKTNFFLNKPLVPGSFAAGGRTVSQKTNFKEFWDSCAQNKTSEISKNALPRTLGLLSAEQDIGNLKKCTSGIMGLLFAEQTVGNLNKCMFRNSGTPGRRTERREFPKMHVQEVWVSHAQNETSEI